MVPPTKWLAFVKTEKQIRSEIKIYLKAFKFKRLNAKYLLNVLLIIGWSIYICCMHINTSKFETELQVRPDDIDMNNHVHSSRYMDYVLAARYEQMERCYQMPMSEFIKHQYAWVIENTFIEFKRPLLIGEKFIVRTWIEALLPKGVKVSFEIIKKNNKIACSGFFNYAMIDANTLRATIIPDWIVARYSI
jgi:acyl-CoA thioester hydrolase/thioesterase-3